MDISKLLKDNAGFIQIGLFIIAAVIVIYIFKSVSENMTDTTMDGTTLGVTTTMNPVTTMGSTTMTPVTTMGATTTMTPVTTMGATTTMTPVTTMAPATDSVQKMSYIEPTLEDDMISPIKFDTVQNNSFNPDDLLPKTDKSITGIDMPDISAQNFLVAGYSGGINTVGTSNKNANLQLRSDPYIPPNTDISPWNVSSITPDQYRKKFEIS